MVQGMQQRPRTLRYHFQRASHVRQAAQRVTSRPWQHRAHLGMAAAMAGGAGPCSRQCRMELICSEGRQRHMTYYCSQRHWKG
eukprot:1150935-Pelagomonas_calceolata.AAC.10